jgi:UDP-N-acetylmuramyl pentapeptide synthase
VAAHIQAEGEMNVLIAERYANEYGTSFQLQCEKKRAFVTFERCGRVQVCNQNACHQVWRGAGKFFQSVAEALEGYKSPEMKAMIQAAHDAKGAI